MVWKGTERATLPHHHPPIAGGARPGWDPETLLHLPQVEAPALPTVNTAPWGGQGPTVERAVCRATGVFAEPHGTGDTHRHGFRGAGTQLAGLSQPWEATRRPHTNVQRRPPCHHPNSTHQLPASALIRAVYSLIYKYRTMNNPTGSGSACPTDCSPVPISAVLRLKKLDFHCEGQINVLITWHKNGRTQTAAK